MERVRGKEHREVTPNSGSETIERCAGREQLPSSEHVGLPPEMQQRGEKDFFQFGRGDVLSPD